MAGIVSRWIAVGVVMEREAREEMREEDTPRDEKVVSVSESIAFAIVAGSACVSTAGALPLVSGLEPDTAATGAAALSLDSRTRDGPGSNPSCSSVIMLDRMECT